MYEKVPGTEKNEQSGIEFKYLLPKKLLLTSKKYGLGIRDPRSEIEKNLSRIRIQRSKKHRIPELQHVTKVLYWYR
jgi:hypothetical protein